MRDDHKIHARRPDLATFDKKERSRPIIERDEKLDSITSSKNAGRSVNDDTGGDGNIGCKSIEAYSFPARECQLALIDFTLSHARRFYSSVGNPLGRKGLKTN